MRAFLLAAFIGTAAMAACSLNPQPIPPGEQADGGADFGGSQGNDASTGDGGVTGAVPPDADAGDAANNEDDAGDASSDADTDASDE